MRGTCVEVGNANNAGGGGSSSSSTFLLDHEVVAHSSLCNEIITKSSSIFTRKTCHATAQMWRARGHVPQQSTMPVMYGAKKHARCEGVAVRVNRTEFVYVTWEIWRGMRVLPASRLNLQEEMMVRCRGWRVEGGGWWQKPIRRDNKTVHKLS